MINRAQNELAHQIAATTRASGDHKVVASVHHAVRQQMVEEYTTTIA